jgi:hypothetical protein
MKLDEFHDVVERMSRLYNFHSAWPTQTSYVFIYRGTTYKLNYGCSVAFLHAAGAESASTANTVLQMEEMFKKMFATDKPAEQPTDKPAEKPTEDPKPEPAPEPDYCKLLWDYCIKHDLYPRYETKKETPESAMVNCQVVLDETNWAGYGGVSSLKAECAKTLYRRILIKMEALKNERNPKPEPTPQPTLVEKLKCEACEKNLKRRQEEEYKILGEGFLRHFRDGRAVHCHCNNVEPLRYCWFCLNATIRYLQVDNENRPTAVCTKCYEAHRNEFPQ